MTPATRLDLALAVMLLLANLHPVGGFRIFFAILFVLVMAVVLVRGWARWLWKAWNEAHFR